MSVKKNAAVTPQLPNYVFEQLIGQGTCGYVYKAFRVGEFKSQETVAVKCIRKESLSKAAVDNLITEITILKDMKSEYIVELKHFEYDKHFIYLIFEYCSGGDLSRLIKRNKRISESLVQHFLQQIAVALKVLRKSNISHMDLKPQNILMSSLPSNRCFDIRLKLADFGFAQYLKSDEVGDSLRGSPLYMAPEILLKRKYDANVDLWSVGIILYECLFGNAPFASSSLEELIEKIKNEAIILPTTVKISGVCKNLILRLLEKNPEKRITFDEFFSHPFVDLEHMPCKESYEKGVSLIQMAVENDKCGKAREALQDYVNGLRYLVPIYNWSDKSKEYSRRLKKKIIQYLNRGEELKNILNVSGLTSEELILLDDAYECVTEADLSFESGYLKEALEKYEKSLTVFIAVLKKLKGKDKELFHEEVNELLSKAEKCSILLNNAAIGNIENKKSTLNASRNVMRNIVARRKSVNDSLSPTCYVQ